LLTNRVGKFTPNFLFRIGYRLVSVEHSSLVWSIQPLVTKKKVFVRLTPDVACDVPAATPTPKENGCVTY
jgi:hypothetical protein